MQSASPNQTHGKVRCPVVEEIETLPPGVMFFRAFVWWGLGLAGIITAVFLLGSYLDSFRSSEVPTTAPLRTYERSAEPPPDVVGTIR